MLDFVVDDIILVLIFRIVKLTPIVGFAKLIVAKNVIRQPVRIPHTIPTFTTISKAISDLSFPSTLILQ